jgi:hypothetical protein
MALVFPSQPQTVGTPYEAPNGVTYIWDGVKWNAAGTPGTGNFNLGNLFVIDQTIAGLNSAHPVLITGNVGTGNVTVTGNLTVSGKTFTGNISAGNLAVTGNILSSHNIVAAGNLRINSTDLTAFNSNLYVHGSRVKLDSDPVVPITTGNYTYSGDNIEMPLRARLNSGGVGVDKSAEFGTEVTKSGTTVTHSEIYMSGGTAEARAITDSAGRSLMYLGVENVSEGKFAGIVAQDPNLDPGQYTTALNGNGLPILGDSTVTYAVSVGVMNPDFTINGLYVDETQTIVATGSNAWKFDQTGDMFVPEQIRNKTNNRAVWDNEVPRDIADLTDNSMLLGASNSTIDINIDGGGAYATYEGTLVRADGGFSGSRWGVNTTIYDGGMGAGGGYTNTLNGGGA